MKSDLPKKQYEQLQQLVEQKQERYQNLLKICQQARQEHEQLVKTQLKINEELISIHDWFKRLNTELTQPLDLNLSLNHINDVQDTMTVNTRHLCFFC